MTASSVKSQQLDHYTSERQIQLGGYMVLLSTAFSPSDSVGDPAKLFDHHAWPSAQAIGTGRGANWFVNDAHGAFVLRHFRRGGAVARVLGNKYWYRSDETTRGFAEFRLLSKLRQQNLPVPEPIAAGYCKSGVWYTAQLLTRRIPNTNTWSSELIENPTNNSRWETVGCTIAHIHGARVDHADLNAHNILVDDRSNIFVIDFDKGVERTSLNGDWRQGNLSRLKRSLHKILPDNQTHIEQGWATLIEAYHREFERVSK